MRSVWSFWSKPWQARRGCGWPSEKHHLLAWVLSVECARRHYPHTTLITDTPGARLLIDGLGLPIEQVSTELDSLAHHDPSVWMHGKLRAYRAQRAPFIHLDTDVFLWNRLPAAVESAPVFAQYAEPFFLGASCYQPQKLQQLMTQQTRGWIPPEWEWALSFGAAQRAECCGILGGQHVGFIQHYADTALQIIEDPRNREGWATLSNKGEHLLDIEQYHLAACVDYHRSRPDSPHREVEIRYLFQTWDEAFDPNAAAKIGYTHLLSETKRSSILGERLEKRVARDFPEQYERCLRYAPQIARAFWS